MLRLRERMERSARCLASCAVRRRCGGQGEVAGGGRGRYGLGWVCQGLAVTEVEGAVRVQMQQLLLLPVVELWEAGRRVERGSQVRTRPSSPSPLASRMPRPVASSADQQREEPRTPHWTRPTPLQKSWRPQRRTQARLQTALPASLRPGPQREHRCPRQPRRRHRSRRPPRTVPWQAAAQTTGVQSEKRMTTPDMHVWVHVRMHAQAPMALQEAAGLRAVVTVLPEVVLLLIWA